MRDFAIQLTHRPGEIARVAHALARKDVNLKSIAAMAFQHQGLDRRLQGWHQQAVFAPPGRPATWLGGVVLTSTLLSTATSAGGV